MNREEILKCAKICVCGDREQDYGSPENNFELIGELWASYLRKKCITPDADCCILPTDVAAMMGLFKIARIATGHGKADNWVDLAGYAACGGELEGGQSRGAEQPPIAAGARRYEGIYHGPSDAVSA